MPFKKLNQFLLDKIAELAKLQFEDEAKENIKADLNNETVSKDYISDEYFSLIRNFRRYSWLLLYLFGLKKLMMLLSYIEQLQTVLAVFLVT